MNDKTKQSYLFPGNGDNVGYWLTPPDLMRKLNDEFHFDFDPCPYPRPAGWDGLKEEWSGKSIWLNAPFVGSLSPWVRKAIDESKKGKQVVVVLPIPAWIELLEEAGAEFRYMGRIRWCRPDGMQTKRPRYPSALFILRGSTMNEVETTNGATTAQLPTENAVAPLPAPAKEDGSP